MVYIHVVADWADIFDTPTKQEKRYLKPHCTPLHTVSRKHVGNCSKTLCDCVSLNVPLGIHKMAFHTVPKPRVNILICIFVASPSLIGQLQRAACLTALVLRILVLPSPAGLSCFSWRNKGKNDTVFSSHVCCHHLTCFKHWDAQRFRDCSKHVNLRHAIGCC